MNNNTLWVLQGFMAFVFIYSGINKSFYSEQKLVAKGQTGVEGLPLSLIRFIGISEILGAIGIIAPLYFKILPYLTPVSAMCFALIMPPAAIIHYRRKEYKSVFINVVIFLICVVIAYGRRDLF